MLKLRIVIPKMDPPEYLIARLRYLETPACRSVMTEENRLSEISEVTRYFKAALSMKTFVPNGTKSDELYN